MIRIVKEMRVWDVDDPGTPIVLPFFPATASCTRVEKDSEHGKHEEITVSARLRWDVDRELLHRDLKMQLTFDNGDVVTVGTEDMPLRLDVTETDYVAVAGKYLRRL